MNEVKERVIRVALDRAERPGAQCWRTMRKTVWPEVSDREVVGGADHTESFRKNTGFHASVKGQSCGVRMDDGHDLTSLFTSLWLLS